MEDYYDCKSCNKNAVGSKNEICKMCLSDPPITKEDWEIEDLREENRLLKIERDSAISSQKESFEESQRVIEELKRQVEKHKEHIWILMDQVKKSEDKADF